MAAHGMNGHLRQRLVGITGVWCTWCRENGWSNAKTLKCHCWRRNYIGHLVRVFVRAGVLADGDHDYLRVINIIYIYISLYRKRFDYTRTRTRTNDSVDWLVPVGPLSTDYKRICRLIYIFEYRKCRASFVFSRCDKSVIHVFFSFRVLDSWFSIDSYS